MHLKDYAEAMKNLPARFSNLTFWRECRKLKDSVVDALEYLNDWGISIENGLDHKLPKNPAEWGPWTSDEQEMARERMGISGDYKLLRNITVEEDTPEVNLGDVQSKDAIIIINSASGCGETPYYRSSSGLVFFAGSGSIKYSVTRISRYYVETTARTSLTFYSKCDNFLAEPVDADIGNLILYCNSSSVLITAGTNIKIYVR